MANIVTWQERGINLLATKNASKDIHNVLTKVHFVQFATFQQPEHKCQILGREVTSCLKPKTVAKIIYFIQPTLRCIGGLHYNLYSPGGPIPHNMAQGFDVPPTLERSGSEQRRAVTSFLLMVKGKAWFRIKDHPAGEGQVGQKNTIIHTKLTLWT